MRVAPTLKLREMQLQQKPVSSSSLKSLRLFFFESEEQKQKDPSKIRIFHQNCNYGTQETNEEQWRYLIL